jgi:hypothetical protein
MAVVLDCGKPIWDQIFAFVATWSKMTYFSKVLIWWSQILIWWSEILVYWSEIRIYCRKSWFVVGNRNLLVGNLFTGNNFGLKSYLLVGNGFDVHDSTIKWLSNDVCSPFYQKFINNPSGIRKLSNWHVGHWEIDSLTRSGKWWCQRWSNQSSVVGNTDQHGRKSDQRGRKSDQCWSNFISARSKIIWSQIRNYFRPAPSKACWSEINLRPISILRTVGRKSIWDRFLF